MPGVRRKPPTGHQGRTKSPACPLYFPQASTPCVGWTYTTICPLLTSHSLFLVSTRWPPNFLFTLSRKALDLHAPAIVQSLAHHLVAATMASPNPLPSRVNEPSGNILIHFWNENGFMPSLTAALPMIYLVLFSSQYVVYFAQRAVKFDAGLLLCAQLVRTTSTKCDMPYSIH